MIQTDILVEPVACPRLLEKLVTWYAPNKTQLRKCHRVTGPKNAKQDVA